MIYQIELNKDDIKSIQRMSKYYTRIYNIYFNYIKDIKNLIRMGKRLRIRFGDIADYRLYNAIPYHISENKFRNNKLTCNNIVYNFRLKGVIIIRNEFYINGIKITIKELSRYYDYWNYEKLIVDMKCSLYRNILTLNIDTDNFKISKRLFKQYNHKWDYIDSDSHITEEYEYKLKYNGF